MVIYKITNTVNGKVYIGQTRRDLETRICEHIKHSESGDVQHHLYSSIRKYGWDKFTVETIAETENPDVLNELESFYIKKFDSTNPDKGYNLCFGGNSNCMDSPVVKEMHDSKMRSPEVRDKISKTMKEYVAKNGFSDEHRQHISDGLKRFYAAGNKPKYKVPQHLSPEHYKKLNEAKYKEVYCIDENNNVVAEFSCVKDAARWWYESGYPVTNCRCLCDRIKSSAKNDKYIRGLKWIYRV